jgi:hypothetical protein
LAKQAEREVTHMGAAVMMAGVLGAAATLVCLLPGMDSYFEW